MKTTLEKRFRSCSSCKYAIRSTKQGYRICKVDQKARYVKSFNSCKKWEEKSSRSLTERKG